MGAEERLRLACSRERTDRDGGDRTRRHLPRGQPELRRLSRWPRAQLVGRTFQSICHPEDVGLNQRLLDRAVAEGSTAFRTEERYRRADGSVVWADLSVTIVRDADGEARRLISQVVDVTDRVEAELLLAHRASHDRLTGLPNRRRFTAAVAAAATTAQR